MNGLHAFPDKENAIREISRIVRFRGKLPACFYIRGIRRFSDFFVSRVYTKQGTFVPPFFKIGDIDSVFKDFSISDKDNLNSIVYFNATKEK